VRVLLLISVAFKLHIIYIERDIEEEEVNTGPVFLHGTCNSCIH